MFIVTGRFSLVLLLNQRWSPPLRRQVSDCSTFRITYAVPSIAVFFSKYNEPFPGMATKHFFKPFVTTPVAPINTGMTMVVHYKM